MLIKALELHEDEGEAVDEADEIRAAGLDLAGDPELGGDEKVVVFGVIPVDDADGDVLLAFSGVLALRRTPSRRSL
jgi:hypothetical protein